MTTPPRTWIDVIRQTLTRTPPEVFADPDPLEPDDPRRFGQHHQAQPTRHDRPEPTDERHEPRTQL